jgi:hypothetical protein
MRDYIAHRIRRPHFANARSIRNALDRARLRQASRLFREAQEGGEGGGPERQALMTIGAPDIRASRVFGTGEAGPGTARH